MADKLFGGIGNVVKLLPAGSFTAYQLLTPLLTSAGTCDHLWNKVTILVVLALCVFFCAFSTFTDGYVGANGKVKYGLVTRKGLWLLGDDNTSEHQPSNYDLAKHKLRRGGFVHAFLVMFNLIVV